METAIKALLTAVLTAAAPLLSHAQHPADSTFTAFEEKCTTLPDGSRNCFSDGTPGAWYDYTTISFFGDSVHLTQMPVRILAADTIYSPSTNGHVYWGGTITRSGNAISLSLELRSCLECPMNMQKDKNGKWIPVTQRKTYSGFCTAAGLRLNGILFKKED